MTELLKTETIRYALTRVKFVARDFFTYADDLVARVAEQFPDTFNDFVSSDLGVMLIEMAAWAADSIAFGQDMYASESYLDTARVRRAVNRLARSLGYKMGPATASSTDLSVRLAAIQAFDVIIPVGFQFQGPNDLVFEASQAVTFPAGEGPLSVARTVSVREGHTVVQNFPAGSAGVKNQRFPLSPGDGRFVAQTTMELTVAGADWTETEFLPYEQTDVYEIDYNAEPQMLRFGDGLAGNIPAAGNDIRASYLSTAGKAGNVPAGTIVDVVQDLVVAFTSIELLIEQPTRSSGGDDREELAKSKVMIPGYVAARDVAVTAGDYYSLANAFRDAVSGAVAVAHAFVTMSAADDITLQSLVTLISDLVTGLASDVAAETADITAAEAAIASEVVDATDGLNDVSNALLSIDASVTTGSALIDGIGPPVGVVLASSLTATDYVTLRGCFANIEAQSVTAMAGEFAAVLAQTNITTALADITDVVANINSLVGVGFEPIVIGYLGDIYDHVDTILSSTCKSNLVTVPILTKDKDGFYAPPSTALVRSLQAYLNSRKEITQIVVVVSGESGLVYAVISGVVGVAAGYVKAKVLGKCNEAINNILRGRDFDSNLYISDLYREVVPKDGVGGIPGVSWATLAITGPADHINSDGTLVVGDSEVITRGTTTLTAEAA